MKHTHKRKEEESPADDLDVLMARYEQQAARDLVTAQPPAQPANARQRLQQGLETQLAPDNKGFAMLAKMGYTPGTGLGAPDRQGAAEPIVLTMRPARSGLGIAEARRQEQEAAEARHAAQVEEQAQHEAEARDAFMASRATAYERRRVAGQLAQAQQACQSLDEAAGIDQHPCWPDPEQLPSAAALQHVLSYLRTRHSYCLYCGTQYGDADDMQQHCPGTDWEAHQQHN